MDVVQAYDLWAGEYDNQPGNLVLDVDEEIFSSLLDNTDITGKVVADIGCGTGRHWKKIQERHPEKLTGYDVSENMLERLRQKFPGAEAYRVKDFHLNNAESNSCDLIVSTLTLAHIRDLGKALEEWTRALKTGGELIITDYHPELLAKGGARTFPYGKKTLVVKSFVHSLDNVRAIARQLYLSEIRFSEREIDGRVRSYYESRGALSLFEKFSGVPLIYGIHFKKTE